jgi:hypothetical protein
MRDGLIDVDGGWQSVESLSASFGCPLDAK